MRRKPHQPAARLAPPLLRSSSCALLVVGHGVVRVPPPAQRRPMDTTTSVFFFFFCRAGAAPPRCCCCVLRVSRSFGRRLSSLVTSTTKPQHAGLKERGPPLAASTVDGIFHYLRSGGVSHTTDHTTTQQDAARCPLFVGDDGDHFARSRRSFCAPRRWWARSVVGGLIPL